jgi:TetR/AcrR family transcriptional regulator
MQIKGSQGVARPPTRKRFSSQERRNQLLQIAVGLFSQRGFEGTTTKAIAAAAGISEAIIFQHFANKEELYASILDYKATETGLKEWEEQLRTCAERLDDEALIFSMVGRILEGNRCDPQFQRLMFQSALSGRPLPKVMIQRILPLHQFLCNYIAKRQKQGAFRRCDPEVAVHAIVSLPSYYGVTKSLFGVDALKLTERDMAKSFTRFLLDGLRASGNGLGKKGRKNANVVSSKP